MSPESSSAIWAMTASSKPPRRQACAASISQLVPLPVMTMARAFDIYLKSPCFEKQLSLLQLGGFCPLEIIYFTPVRESAGVGLTGCYFPGTILTGGTVTF